MKRGPKPGAAAEKKAAAAALVAVAVAASAAPADIHASPAAPAAQEQQVAAQVETPGRAPSRDPLQRSRDIGTMPVAELKAYAKQIGVRQRDIDELTEDRLRQNCMLTVNALVEAYTE